MAKAERPIIFGEVLFDVYEDGSEYIGGAPFNVAWHLEALGIQPVFISRIGSDRRGERIMETIRGWGLDSSGVQVDDCRPTGTVRVKSSDNGASFEIPDNQAYDHIEAEPALECIREVPAGVFYHGSLIGRSRVSGATLNHLKTDIPRRIFVDVNLRPPWWHRDQIELILRNCRWIKLSADELDAIQNGSGETDTNLENRARRLMVRSRPEAVIVTMGVKGAFAVTRKGELHRTQAVRVDRMVDSVGAGDAFSAMMIFGLMHGWNPGKMLRSGAAFASEVCRVQGALIHDRKIYDMFVEEWRTDEQAD
ncbi:carbohydrate kinase [bacterium]|nr:carbohydrate kinase [candidate division CSSED10-310 bacterium]